MERPVLVRLGLAPVLFRPALVGLGSVEVVLLVVSLMMVLVFVMDVWLTEFLQAAAVVLHSVQVEAAVVVVVVEEAVPAAVVVDDWSSLVIVSVPSMFGLSRKLIPASIIKSLNTDYQLTAD